MSYVEPATADTTTRASRTRTSSTVGDLDANVSSPAVGDFASLFASTRQSLTWLNGLFNRQSDQVAASHRRQQQITDTLNQKRRHEASGRTAASELEPSVSRADQLRESKRSRTQTADHEADTRRDRFELAESAREDRRTVDKSRPDSTRYAQQQESAEYCRSNEANTAQSESQHNEYGSVEPASTPTSGTVAADGTEGVTSSSASTSSNTANNPVLVGPPQAQGPPTLTLQTQANAAVSNVQPVMADVSAKGGETGTGVSQDMLQASSAAKSVEGAAKPGAVTVDFQTLLAQVGKGQAANSPSSNGLSAMTGKQVAGETINLANNESVQELARVVRSSLNGRHARMVLRLDPPELGQMRVDVRMHNQELTLRFQTETQAGTDMLQSRLSDLRAALEQHGIQLDRVQVEFRPPAAENADGQQTFDRQFHQGASGSHDSAFGQAPGDSGQAGDSFGSSGFGNEFDQTPSEPLPADEMDLSGDDVAHPAETGVDLVV